MWRVANIRRLRALHRQESGTSAVLVALLLVVLIGLAAIVLDLGNQMWEARMQQNSADAAALAAAQDCAHDNCHQHEDTAQEYASENTPRGSHAVVEELNEDDGEITVRAETGDELDGGTLSTWLASAIGTDELRAARTATAMWGSPGGGPALPITIGACEWKNATGAGDEWDDIEPDDFPADSGLLYIHDPQDADECLGPAGQHYPGSGFGYLDEAEHSDCTAEVEEGEADGEPGNNLQKYDCDQEDFEEYVEDEVELMIPIFQDSDGTGSNTTYDIAGFGGFILEGYYLGGQWEYPEGDAPCDGGDRCLEGRFVSFVMLGDHDDFGGHDFGAQVVVLTE